VFVNGKPVGSGDNFNHVAEFDVASLLRPGTNVLAVAVENGGPKPNPAGLIAALEVRLGNGETGKFSTDREWLAATNADESWQTRTSADAGWKAARELGAWGMAPWGKISRPAVEPEVYPDYERLAAILRADGVAPDFESDGPLRYTHRRDGRTEIYFVANRSAETVKATAAFRVAGKVPELWNPLAGASQRARIWEEREGRTFVPLRLDAHDSVFVVFRQAGRPPRSKATDRNWDEMAIVAEVDGPWEVRYQPGRGAPKELTFDSLVDWSRHSDLGVRFFSGAATYHKTFDWNPQQMPSANRKSPIFLDLGRVEVMARVKVNGEEVGTVWKAPFRVRVSDALRAGENQLEIEVANLWPNRLIGDAGLPAEQRVAWTTWNPFTKDSELLESGLLGPVRLMAIKEDVR